MSYIQEKRAEFSQLMGGSFSMLALIKRELAIYFAVFAGAALLAELSTALDGIVALLSFIGYFIAQYLLYAAMMRKAGLVQDEGNRMLGFAGMALVLIFPISIGANFFVIPGIILAAKWVMAPAYIVARDQNLFEAIGASWRASEFNTVPLSLAFTVMCLIWIVAFSVLSAVAEALLPTVGDAAFWIAVHILPILLMGLSVSAYRQLSDDTNRLTQVFA